MSSKKNIAITMAAVSVVGNISSVFAASQKYEVEKEIFSKQDKRDLVAKIKEMAKVVYKGNNNSSIDGNCVYAITLNNKKYNLEKDSIDKEVNIIVDKINQSDENLVVEIVDKGHKKLKDGSVLNKDLKTYENIIALKTTVDNFYKVTNKKPDFVLKDKIKAVVNDGVLEIGLLKDDKVVKTIKVNVGDKEINFERPMVGTRFYDKNTDDIASITGFDLADATEIESKNLAKITIKRAITENSSINELYDGYRLTSKGSLVFNGKKDINIESNEDTGLYELKITYVDQKGTLKEAVIKDASKGKLESLKSVFETNNTNQSTAKVNVLAGYDRFDTAVQIAKQSKKTNIILVNADNIVDGLASAPLAREKNASILLTNKDSLPEATLNYLKEKVSNTSGVHITVIGGTNAISPSIEKELNKLIDKSRISRIGGDNRHETSVKIAKEIKGSVVDKEKTFFVGANGEADAMSISAFASEISAPIIVGDFDDKISSTALEVMKDKEINIIGGTNSVSKNVESQLVKIDRDDKVERVYGNDRQETNANVINKYYKNNISDIYIAKDGMNKKGELVDALAAAPLAAENKAPILLATDGLSKSQQNVLEEKTSFGVDITQIGNGISLSLIEKISKILFK